jgi:hypothetical protein
VLSIDVDDVVEDRRRFAVFFGAELPYPRLPTLSPMHIYQAFDIIHFSHSISTFPGKCKRTITSLFFHRKTLKVPRRYKHFVLPRDTPHPSPSHQRCASSSVPSLRQFVQPLQAGLNVSVPINFMKYLLNGRQSGSVIYRALTH